MKFSVDELYRFFDLPSNSTDDELRSAYCEFLLKYHPDRNPDAIEFATRKTQEINNVYEQLKRQRKSDFSPEARPTRPINWTEAKPWKISLERIASLKKELRDAWNAFNERQYDIKAALSLIRAAFDAGRPEIVDDLITNPHLIDAAAILARVFSLDDAVRVALMWSESLRTKQHMHAAIQVLSDLNRIIGTESILSAQIRDNLRSLHYGVAQGYSDRQKPQPATRIYHLTSIVNLGFELGYVYKLLAQAYHELGDDDVARKHLRHAMQVDPQLIGAKTIMRALGVIPQKSPQLRQNQKGGKHIYTQSHEIPAVEQIISWFRCGDWEPIFAHADCSRYAPRILPRARRVLVSVSAVLGECNDRRTAPVLEDLLKSVYWDVRQAAMLSLAKIGDIRSLKRLREISHDRGTDGRSVIEPLSFAEARAKQKASSKSMVDLIVDANGLIDSNSYEKPGELGRMRWYLQCALKEAEPKQALDILLLLIKCCLSMNDWPYVIKIIENGVQLADYNDARVLELQVSLAAAFVLVNVGSVSLRCLCALFELMPASVQSSARKVIWSALTTPEFIGEENYLWALRVLFESTVANQDADRLLLDLHTLARVMEPIGQKEMGTWLRHMLRAEAPGHWFGGQYDRLGCFSSPQLSSTFELSVQQMCEEFKPIIRARLVSILLSQRVVVPPAPSRLSS
jgi:hypothetical protein